MSDRWICVSSATEKFLHWVMVREVVSILEGSFCSLLLLCGAVTARSSFTESTNDVPILPLPHAAAALRYPPSRVPFSRGAVHCCCIFKLPWEPLALVPGILAKISGVALNVNPSVKLLCRLQQKQKPLILNGISCSSAVSSPREGVLWAPSGAREAQGVGLCCPWHNLRSLLETWL